MSALSLRPKWFTYLLSGTRLKVFSFSGLYMRITPPSRRHAPPITWSSAPGMEGLRLGPGLSPGGARGPQRRGRALAFPASRVLLRAPGCACVSRSRCCDWLSGVKAAVRTRCSKRQVPGQDGCQKFCIPPQRLPALPEWLRGRGCGGRRGSGAHGLAVPPEPGR